MIMKNTMRIFIILVSLYANASVTLFASQSQVRVAQQSEEAEKLVDNMIGKVNKGILTENDLQEYLSKGGKIDAVNVIGRTALRMATIANRIEIVELLIAFDADVNFQNEFGDSVLSCAARVGNVEMVRFLFENNADINMRNVWGWPALAHAIYGAIYVDDRGIDYVDVVVLLLNAGADPYLRIYYDENSS